MGTMSKTLRANANFIWIVVSIAAAITGYVLKSFEETASIGVTLYLIGWISSLIAVGYFVSSPTTLIGKIMFVFTLIMIAGVACKIMNLQIAKNVDGNALILAGLAGVGVCYLIGYWKDKKQKA